MNEISVTKAKSPDSHWLICGPTGTGKSTLIETELMKRVGRCSIVGIFPHKGDVATRLIERLWTIDRRNVVWDCAGSTDRVLGIKRGLPSTSSDKYRKRIENDETKQRLIEAMLARRQQQNVYEMPLIEDGLGRGLDLWLNQDPIKPEKWIQFAFRPESEQYSKMVIDCSDQDARFRALEVKRWTKMEQLKSLLPAKRVIDGTFGSPLYLGRADGLVSIGELIDDGKIALFEGDPAASRSAIRFWFITIIHEVCRHVERGAKRKVILVIDEANSWVLVDPYLCRMMAELRKYGLQVWISVQAPAFGDEQTLEEVLTNCNRIYCFRPQSQITAQLMGYLMGMPVIDPNALHWMEERWRQVHDRYDAIPTLSVMKGTREGIQHSDTWNTSEGTGMREDGSSSENVDSEGKPRRSESSSKGITSNSSRGIGGSDGVSSDKSYAETRGTQYLSQFKETKQEVRHYFSPSDQMMLITGKMMQMQTGEVMIKDHEKVWMEKVKMLPEIQDLRSFKEMRMLEIQSEIKKRPIFTEPSIQEETENAAERVMNRRRGKREKD